MIIKRTAIKQGYGFVNEGDVDVLDDRAKYQRTTWMYVQNDTPGAIQLAVLQATCRYPLPAPYYSDTGAFVAGTNMGAGASIALDPWDIGGRDAPIAATAGSGSVKLIYNGQEYDIALAPYAEAPDGSFYPQLGWKLEMETIKALDGQDYEVPKVSRVQVGLMHVRR